MAILPMGPAHHHDSMQDSMFDTRPEPQQDSRPDDYSGPTLQAYSHIQSGPGSEVKNDIHDEIADDIYEPAFEPAYDQADTSFSEPEFNHDSPSPMMAAAAPEPVPEPLPESVHQAAAVPSPAPKPAALTLISVDDFAALEDRIHRAVSLVRSERQARIAAEERAAALEAQFLATEAQTSTIESLHKEIDTLRAEREQVRNRVERLLGQLDALEL